MDVSERVTFSLSFPISLYFGIRDRYTLVTCWQLTTRLCRQQSTRVTSITSYEDPTLCHLSYSWAFSALEDNFTPFRDSKVQVKTHDFELEGTSL